MQILKISEKLVKDVARIYPFPWKEHPWNENFQTEEVEEFLREDMGKEGFQGYVVVSDKNLIGFTWGFQMEAGELIKYAGWVDEVINFKRFFYIAEVGVLSDFRKRGVGEALTEMIIKKVKRPIVLRTDYRALAALRLYEKLFFKPLLSLNGEHLFDFNYQNRFYWWLK